ncbi:MAG: PKD domain-containing protein [Flavobacteriales bacterium]|nr:PKD domain-containing protein [Flavobacteriales bacterium]
MMYRKSLLTMFLFAFSFAYGQTCNIVSSDFVCQDEPMSFDVNSSSGIQSVLWDMGDGTTGTQKSFNHKYSTPGIKTVKVTVQLSGGKSCTDTKTVTVYKLPEFRILMDPSNVFCLSKNKVCFIDSSLGGDPGIDVKKRIILWDDGDQTTTNYPPKGDKVCHTYANTGTFKVTIELTNEKDCKVKKEITIVILPDVIPYFEFEIGKGCDSAKVIFKDVTQKDSQNILNRIYDWGDGSKSSTPSRSVIHYYKAGGFYQVKLTLQQQNGCNTSRDTIINVFIPEIKFDAKADSKKKCYGGSFRLDQVDVLQNAYYEWLIGGQEQEGKTVNVSPDLGKHIISLRVTYEGCQVTKVVDTIEVVGISPEIRVLNGNQCSNLDTVIFCEKDRRYGVDSVRFFWNFGDNLAPQCTSWVKKGINSKSNCNYTLDSSTKHKYVNGNCRNWSFSVTDLTNGCNTFEEGTINLIKPDTINFYYSADRKCLGLKPEYKILFSHDICKTARIYINKDSACDRNDFLPFSGTGYFYQQTCDPSGKVTVGFAVGFGNAKVYRSCDTSDYYIDLSRVCTDTIWYHHWFRLLPEPFSPFEVSGRCIPATVRPVLLDSTQNEIVLQKWDWGDDTKPDSLITDGTDPLLPIPTHVFKKAGAYKVRYYLENINRCYGVYDQTLILGFSMGMQFDTIICPGIKVRFFDSIHYMFNGTEYWRNPNRKKLGLESFKWDFDDGKGFNIDTVGPVVQFANKGIRTIRLAAVDSAGCRDTIRKNIYVGGVTAGIKSVNKKIICDDIIQFFDSSYSDFKPPADSIIKHYWDFGDLRNPSYLKDPYHFYSYFGEFTVFHKVENTRGCKDSVAITIFIDGPKPEFEIVSDTVGCVPFKAEFKNTSTKTKDYIWYFGDPLKSKLSTDKDTNVSFTYTSPGIYYIYLFGSDSVVNPNAGNSIYYCKTTFPDTNLLNHPVRRIVVLPIPKVDFEVDLNLCRNKEFAVVDRSDSIYTRYKWVLTGKDSVETNKPFAKLRSKDTGTYVIKYTPTYTPKGPYQRSCFDTISKTVRITDIEASFDTIRDPFCPIYTFINTSKNLKSFSWDLGHAAAGEKENIRYENTVTHNYVPDKGRFYPCLFVESIYGCRDTICTEFDVNFNVKAIVPNVFTPDNQDDLNDSYDIDMENVDEYDLSIFNRWGQLVYHSKVDGYRNDGFNWNGRDQRLGTKCPEGVYFYIFKFRYKCQELTQNASGTITLIRPEN